MDAVQDWELPIAPRRPRRPQIRVERERPCDYRQPVCVTDSSVHSAGVEPLAPRGCHPLNMWARRLSSSGPARQGRPTEATERRVLSCATPPAWIQGAERNLGRLSESDAVVAAYVVPKELGSPSIRSATRSTPRQVRRGLPE